jgi:hypothetical protein
MNDDINVLCCSILKNEVREVFNKNFKDLNVNYLDSMLHMTPSELHKLIDLELNDYCKKTLLIYGDCTPSMHNYLLDKPNIVRLDALNCCEMILGKRDYQAIRKRGCFALLPEWTKRWKEVFVKELGFEDKYLAESFIQDYGEGFIYLDTGLDSNYSSELAEIEEYFNSKVVIKKVSLDNLTEIIEVALNKLRV